MSEKLYEATRSLLAAQPRTISLASIAEGAGVKRSWLSAFSRDEIPDPGVKKVQRLYDYLSQRA
jgi:transcriptional regulator with XRE-family HTH domain